jgi:hypothetical protein
MSTRNAQRPWHRVVLSLGLIAAVLAGAFASRAPDLAAYDLVSGTLQQPPVVDRGQAPLVTVVYEDDAILPEHRDAVRVIRESGSFERSADWINRVVALPYPLEIRVTDALPPGVDVPTAELDGRTIYYAASWLEMTRAILVEYVDDALREGSVPSVVPAEKFNADDLNVWAHQFVLGHELGHALTHQLTLPLTYLEEPSVDGFAAFSTLNGTDGPGPALGAAILFDEVARRQGVLNFETYSDNHPVVQQRTYNFICFIVGSDPERLRHPLVVEGYLPETRAVACPLEWAQLNYGWWTVLEPHLTTAFRPEGTQARARARQDLIAEEKALQELLREPRGQ